MKKNWLLSAGIICISIVLLICIPCLSCKPETTAPSSPSTSTPSTSTPAVTKPIELSYATFRPPADPQSEEWLTPMCQEIEKRTNGQVKFTIHWASALGASQDQYALVKDGVADMTDISGAWVPGKFILSDVGNLPFAAQDPANLVKAMYALYDKGYFDSQYDEVKFIAWTATPAYRFLFRNKMPMKYEELKGLKARAPGGLATDCEKAIGMVPVTVLPADAYTAWQTGLVDVWVHPAGAVVKYKFNELPTKALLDVGFFIMVNSGNIFNQKKFDSLPADVQQTILDVAQEYCYVYVQSGIDTDNDAIKVMKEANIEVYNWPDSETEKLKSAAAGIWKTYIDDLEDKGLPGKELTADFVSILEGLGEKPPSVQ
jgi:TRAP-type C4-dicarboxylate transport system substrate-binding protein